MARSRFDGGGEEDGEDEEVVAEDVWDMVKEAQLRDTKRQIDTLQDDVKDLQDKVVDLEELLEQKVSFFTSLLKHIESRPYYYLICTFALIKALINSYDKL